MFFPLVNFRLFNQDPANNQDIFCRYVDFRGERETAAWEDYFRTNLRYTWREIVIPIVLSNVEETTHIF
jgi:hypothetical protein